MEDIKLWRLEGSRTTPLASNNRLESEEVLEEALVENPGLLIEGLTLVGRQTPTEGGPLDLLGVDKDGRLAVFELKRGRLSRKAVAQIIDYASHLDDMDLDALASHITEQSGQRGIDEIKDFSDWYDRKFGPFDESGLLASLKPLRLFLVGLGADDRTGRMVRFLAENSGLDISLLTFHGFDEGGKTLLAKRVEVSRSEDGLSTPAGRHGRSSAELKAILDSDLDESDVAGQFEEVKSMFEAKWPKATRSLVAGGRGFSLRFRRPDGKYRALGRFEVRQHELLIVFYPRVIRLCRDEFRPCLAEIEYELWKPGPDPLPEEGEQPAITFKVTPEVWTRQKERLTSLVESVYEAWLSAEEDGGQP